MSLLRQMHDILRRVMEIFLEPLLGLRQHVRRALLLVIRRAMIEREIIVYGGTALSLDMIVLLALYRHHVYQEAHGTLMRMARSFGLLRQHELMILFGHVRFVKILNRRVAALVRQTMLGRDGRFYSCGVNIMILLLMIPA